MWQSYRWSLRLSLIDHRPTKTVGEPRKGKTCGDLSHAATGVVKVGMNTQVFYNTIRRSLAGELSSGEVVGALSTANVEAHPTDYMLL